MRTVSAGFRLQFRFYRNHPDLLVPLMTAPLYGVIFTVVLRQAGRPDLAGPASLTPFFMSLWWFALFSGGWVIQTDRWEGTLEHLVSAPANFGAVVFGRICAILPPGVLAFAETWLIARYALHTDVTVRHWPVLLASFILTLFAMAATALLMAVVFVLARNAVTLSNSASYPFYVLGGILVPIGFLPSWTHPISRMVFLSWSAGLLRGSVTPGPVPDAALGLGAIAGLGLLALLAGCAGLTFITRRIRARGELALA